MQQKFPVIIPTWQSVSAHAEKQMKRAEQGLALPLRRSARLDDQLQNRSPAVKLLSKHNLDGAEG